MNTARTAAALTTARAAFFAPRVAARSASLALAAVMTLAVLGSLDGLASREHAAMQPELAQAAASAPRS